MSFRAPLEALVRRTPGAVGAVFADAEGETIDAFTLGDEYDIRLTGAHHGILLQTLRRAARQLPSCGEVSGVTIRADDHTYSVVPVEDDNFLVLVQDSRGIPSQGLRELRRTVPSILELM